MPILIDIRKLRVINLLIKDGATNVANALESMAGVRATVQIKSLAFVDPDDVANEIGETPLYSSSVRLHEPPYGVFFLTFADETAIELAELMTGMETDSEGKLTDLQESALREICNIMTSGFIDGMANTLQTTIGMGTPEIMHADGEVIAEKALSHIHEGSLTIVLDAVVDMAESDASFEIRIFLIPDPGAFVNVIDKMELEDIASAASGAFVDELGGEDAPGPGSEEPDATGENESNADAGRFEELQAEDFDG